ncbi:transforming growth factor-beta receptor-associated protein 1 [Gouania willdenowi]|uniref:Transforming growth factor-beta receptor-associated protein 1-like n=1 Tax=Gouania willdenowi TaxID=441366 RepID=A0A8C5NDN8_GOUWI|nr:transforming growth factor-beta receptor-associated protein 1-like [Gouania willdenowi]
MYFRAFSQTHIYEKPADSKEKSRTSIQCIECYERNIYTGSRDATVQHLILTISTNGTLSAGQRRTREGMARKLGSSSPITQLRTVPLYNYLLVLWDRSITALNMLSLEPVPALKKIQQVSLFEVYNALDQALRVEMVTSSSSRKLIRIHRVGVESWEVLKEVTMQQSPLAFAVDGTSLCVATSDRYLLCDLQTGNSEELFPHSHSRQHIVVTSVEQGEFLLHGPENLGMFVLKTGICQRPPLLCLQDVLAATACFPYVLILQPQTLSVYSVLDQKQKQSVSVMGAKGLISTPDGVLVFTERDIFSLALVPLEEQIHSLVGHERLEEALMLLDGVQSHRPLDSYKELQKAIACLAGFAHFYQGEFSEARDLFIKGELDPREIICLYPDVKLCLCEDFQSGLDQVNKSRGLQVLCNQGTKSSNHYLAFLGEFLRAVRGTQQALKCNKDVDSALLRLYVTLMDTEMLQELVASSNDCCIDHCVPVLEENSRYFALGSLYESNGMLDDAIKTWMSVTDGINEDPTCSDAYGHIVRTLSQLRNSEMVWTFAEWTVQTNQKIGVHIFTKRPPDDQFEVDDVLVVLETFPQALLLYLEFLIYKLNSKEERHHSSLALAYVSHSLSEEGGTGTGSGVRETRGKLQQLLWESKHYNVSTVYESLKSTSLHSEKAIVLGRSGKHSEALQLLVDEARDPEGAEVYCDRASQGRDSSFRQALLLTLLKIYLNSEELTGTTIDLLNKHLQVFPLEDMMQLLPDSWSVQLVSPFIVSSLRGTFHRRQMVKLEKALAQAELFRHKVIWIQASKTMCRMNKDQTCSVCTKGLTEPPFASNLQGELMHVCCTGSSGF